MRLSCGRADPGSRTAAAGLVSWRRRQGSGTNCSPSHGFPSGTVPWPDRSTVPERVQAAGGLRRARIVNPLLLAAAGPLGLKEITV